MLELKKQIELHSTYFLTITFEVHFDVVITYNKLSSLDIPLTVDIS